MCLRHNQVHGTALRLAAYGRAVWAKGNGPAGRQHNGNTVTAC